VRGAYHALLLLAALAAPAFGEGPSFVGGDAGPGLEGAVLVGSAGEIYRRHGDTWRRRAGGTAAELVGAWARPKAEIIAAGARTPAYRHDGHAWSRLGGASLGAAILAAPDSPRPGIAVGRRVYVLESGAPRWTPLPMTPAPVTALWTRAPSEAFAVAGGRVLRLAGGWRPVPIPETVVALGGRPPLALGAAGGVYALGAAARRLVVDPALSGFRPRLVLGRALVGEEGLARVAAGRVVPLGAPPAAGDAVSVLVEIGEGRWLVATRSGRVFTGTPGAWTEEPVDRTPPAPDHPPAPAPPALIAPAASR
jgi:hypothetical protein